MSPDRIMALRAVLGVPAGDIFAVLAWDSPRAPNGWRLAAVGKGRVRFLGEPYPGAKAPPLERSWRPWSSKSGKPRKVHDRLGPKP